jgi:DNA polymerase III alpha subunit
LGSFTARTDINHPSQSSLNISYWYGIYIASVIKKGLHTVPDVVQALVHWCVTCLASLTLTHCIMASSLNGFINPERIDLPDLDLDFEHERRDEVYRYLQRTYKNVAHIPVFSGMNAKQVLKDVCRFKEVSLDEIDPVCKEMERNTAKQDKAGLNIKKVEEQPDKYPLFAKFKQRNYAVVDIAKVLEGQVRQTGIHAGGVIVAAHDLTDRCALEWRKGDVSINFDMYDINDLSLAEG